MSSQAPSLDGPSGWASSARCRCQSAAMPSSSAPIARSSASGCGPVSVGSKSVMTHPSAGPPKEKVETLHNSYDGPTAGTPWLPRQVAAAGPDWAPGQPSSVRTSAAQTPADERRMAQVGSSGRHDQRRGSFHLDTRAPTVAASAERPRSSKNQISPTSGLRSTKRRGSRCCACRTCINSVMSAIGWSER